MTPKHKVIALSFSSVAESYSEWVANGCVFCSDWNEESACAVVLSVGKLSVAVVRLCEVGCFCHKKVRPTEKNPNG